MLTLGLLFWLLVIIGCVFGWAGATNQPWARWGWFPTVLLIILLGLKVFGFPIETH